MATQLGARKTGGGKLRGLTIGSGDLRIPPRYLVLGAAAIIALAYVSLVVGTMNARADRDAARARYDDTLALVSAPPAQIEGLRSEVDAARMDVATAQALLAPPALDLESDAGTQSLVVRAQAAGLTVRGIERVTAAPVKVQDVAYDQTALRMTVAGPVALLNAFLANLDETDPGVIPTLATLDLEPGGSATTVLVFHTYEVAPATPVAGAPGVGR